MPRRKPRIEPIRSANYEVIIENYVEDCCGLHNEHHQKTSPKDWCVMGRLTCATTDVSTNWEDYYSLKRVWRRSKGDFDSACRFMKFNDLFSFAGVNL